MVWRLKRWYWFSRKISTHPNVNNDNDVSNNNAIVASIWGEKIEKRGEDAEPLFAYDNGVYLLGVFDGLGGAGSRLYSEQGIQQTGAYIASRLAKNIVQNHLLPRIQNMKISGVDAISSLKQALISEFRKKAEVASSGQPATLLKTNLIHTFPTTMALLWTSNENALMTSVHVAWAGDSRCYILTPENGLQLLTVDDVHSDNDNNGSLSQDIPLSNYINADTGFYINYYFTNFQKPLILIAATDGCFGYVPTPAHFEYLLIQTLQSVNNATEWKEQLLTKLDGIAGDDISMVLLGIGWDNFAMMKNSFSHRFADLESVYRLSELKHIEIKIMNIENRLKKMEQTKSKWLNEKEKMSAQKEQLYSNLWHHYEATYNLFEEPNNGKTGKRRNYQRL